MPSSPAPLLTLEPVSDVVRAGLEARGWELSGMQKTTSYRYRGRWSGQELRSAYLFFDHPELPATVSLDATVDEGAESVTASIALVIDGPTLDRVGRPERLLEAVAAAVASGDLEGLQIPVAVRLALPDANRAGARAEPSGSAPSAAAADLEVRVRARVPGVAIRGGEDTTGAVVRAVADAFRRLVDHAAVRVLLGEDD